jgi:hypothetical protein
LEVGYTNPSRFAQVFRRVAGRTGLQVSRLGLGTMNFGMVTDEAPACEIILAAPYIRKTCRKLWLCWTLAIK